jgi:hypothetical protein
MRRSEIPALLEEKTVQSQEVIKPSAILYVHATQCGLLKKKKLPKIWLPRVGLPFKLNSEWIFRGQKNSGPDCTGVQLCKFQFAAFLFLHACGSGVPSCCVQPLQSLGYKWNGNWQCGVQCYTFILELLYSFLLGICNQRGCFKSLGMAIMHMQSFQWL